MIPQALSDSGEYRSYLFCTVIDKSVTSSLLWESQSRTTGPGFLTKREFDTIIHQLKSYSPNIGYCSEKTKQGYKDQNFSSKESLHFIIHQLKSYFPNTLYFSYKAQLTLLQPLLKVTAMQRTRRFSTSCMTRSLMVSNWQKSTNGNGLFLYGSYSSPSYLCRSFRRMGFTYYCHFSVTSRVR